MKRRTTTSLLSAALLAFALPVAGFAQSPGENFFTNWDTDGDGQVTLEEVLERRGDLFTTFDFDEDGILSAEELANHDAMRDAMQDGQDRPDMAARGQRGGRDGVQGQGRGPWMDRQGMMPRQGQMMPAPGWGAQPQGYGYGMPHPGWGQPPQGWGYAPAQPGWGQPHGMMQPGWGAQPMPPRGGMGGPQGQPGAGPQGMQQQMGGALDADGNGQISREEFVSAGEAWLQRFDRNRDGAVNAQDFPTAPRQ